MTNDDYLGVWPPEQDAYLVWFNRIERDWLFSLEQVRQVADLTAVASLSDGQVFRVTRKAPG
jgi:hypothetical protein